jgi:tellurite resistance protein TerC
VLRAVMILVGAWLIAQFHWILYLFGAFLVFTGIKMWIATGKEPDLEANPALKWIRGHMKIAPGYDGEKFFTVHQGVRMATPLFVVILLIGIVDIIFAVDSIPAIFAITMDPFIVLTSNVFAILGLRAMYFLLAGMHERFHLLSYGLAIVLVFIGTKMLLIDVYKIPVAWSLGVTLVVLVVTMVLSLKIPPRGKPQAAYPFAARHDDEEANRQS